MLNLDKMIDLPSQKVDMLVEISQRNREPLKKAGLYINDIVREDIFSILDHYCTVVYYPLPDEEENDGFHITMPVDYKEGSMSEHFVFLNTAKPLEKQVFAAAHELGHIWVSEDEFWDVELERVFLRTQDNLEAVMNRFAAEFLMPQRLFRQSAEEQLGKFVQADHRIFVEDAFRVIASLMDEFCVPAQAVICRFYETGIMKKEVCKQLLTGPVGTVTLEEYQKYFDSILEQCISEGGYTKLLKSTKKRGIKDFPEVLNDVECKNLFPVQKIERLRDMLGIPKIEGQTTKIDVGEVK